MKFIIGLLAMLLPLLSMAQPRPIKPLTVGDTVPDIEITNLYNYPASKIHLSELKGKLVILDFWSTWCGACIESFPKMEQLQKEFGDQIQVILVNTYQGDTIQQVKSFFKNRKQRTGQNMELPYSLLQSSLAEYFPYKFIPHCVWINKGGKIAAITSQIEVSYTNIRGVLNGNKTDLHTKKDLLNFNRKVSLFVNGNGGKGDDFLYRSIFTNYIEGLGNATGLQRNGSGKITRFQMLNASIPLLLRTAYSSKMNYPSNRIINKLKNPSVFDIQSTVDTLFYKNYYCYEINTPPSGLDEIFTFLQEDIYRLFKIRVINQDQQLKCIDLHYSEKLNEIKSKGGNGRVSIEKVNLKKYLRNQPLNTLVDILNNMPAFRDVQVIDETGILFNIDLELPSSFYNMDIHALKKCLEKIGFVISENERKLPVAVITDK